MLAITGLQHPGIASGFSTCSFANTTNRVEIYSLPEPAACLKTTSHHSVVRTIFGKADPVGTEMECRALHEDEEKGGGYPTAALERMVEGKYPPFNPDFLVKDKDSQQ
jgi:hypothetical protein